MRAVPTSGVNPRFWVRVAPHVAIFAAMLVWSANATFVKIGLGHIRPASFMGARFLTGAVASWALAFALHGRAAAHPPRARVPMIAIFGLGANQIFYTVGVNLTTAVDISLIQGLTPVLTGALLMLTTRGRLARTQVIALGVGLMGVGGVVLATPVHAGGSAVGDLINLGAPVCYAIFLVLTAADAARLPATRITPWILSGPLIVLVPIALVDAVRAPEDWLGALPALLVTGLLATTFAYTVGMWALPRLGVMGTTIYSYFQPPLGATIGAVFLGEAYQPIQLGGTVLIVVTAYLGRSRVEPTIAADAAVGAESAHLPDSERPSDGECRGSHECGVAADDAPDSARYG